MPGREDRREISLSQAYLESESDLPKGVTFEDHILKLIKETYGVNIPACDIQACHPLSEHSANLRIWNRRPGSAFHKLVTAVKCGGIPKPKSLGKSPETKEEGGAGGSRDVREKGAEQSAELGGGAGGSGGVSDGQPGGKNKNGARVFINFHLTRKRYKLLNHLKALKREKKIFKFYTNENGEIFVKVNTGSKKMALTINQNIDDDKTFTPTEFDDFLKSK